jgi:hypothetical protein
VVFADEEGGLSGSRAMIGKLGPEALQAVSHSGLTIADGIRAIGGDPERLAEARRRPGDLAAFVELHIEQGAVLYDEGVDIGVVTGIVGIQWWDVIVTGVANHAGTTPMDKRQDALLAAAARPSNFATSTWTRAPPPPTPASATSSRAPPQTSGSATKRCPAARATTPRTWRRSPRPE